MGNETGNTGTTFDEVAASLAAISGWSVDNVARALSSVVAAYATILERRNTPHPVAQPPHDSPEPVPHD